MFEFAIVLSEFLNGDPVGEQDVSLGEEDHIFAARVSIEAVREADVLEHDATIVELLCCDGDVLGVGAIMVTRHRRPARS